MSQPEIVRARLTPKPWRCGLKQLRVYFPWSEPGENAAVEKWLAAYKPQCDTHAVCELIETIGADIPAREIAPFVALHDKRTSVGTGLPLA